MAKSPSAMCWRLSMEGPSGIADSPLSADNFKFFCVNTYTWDSLLTYVIVFPLTTSFAKHEIPSRLSLINSNL